MSEAGPVGLPYRASDFADRTAIVDPDGEAGYDWLWHRAELRAAQLLGEVDDLDGARVAFLMPPGLEYVVTLWGVWLAGGIAVPLGTHYPEAELAHVLDVSETSFALADEGLDDRLRPLAEQRGLSYRTVEPAGYPVQPLLEVITPEERNSAVELHPEPSEPGLPTLSADRGALLLFTSGTTSRPKGVELTHGNLSYSVDTLVDAWDWREDDRILHVLPLHHTHGLVNALSCALAAGACVELPGGFDARYVWEAFASGRITVFMAVPTMYVKLVQAWDDADPFTRRRWSRGARGLRLMVSGSAALPAPLFGRWEELTGHRLLERYGMTEVGMALSNPYEGERRPGTVGRPLPGVDLRLVQEDGQDAAGGPGEIEIRGPGVFRRYWNDEAATDEAFRDGWFRTGDQAVIEDDYYRILGRNSVDIIKTGGYKVSALEIEAVLREHPAVVDCAVVGVPDVEWGERVCAAVIPATREGPDEAVPWLQEPQSTWLADQLTAWLRERLAPHKVPRAWRVVTSLPANALGKVTKPEIRQMFPTQRR